MSNIELQEWRLSKYLSLFAGLSRREAEKECMSETVMVNNAPPKNAAVIVTKSDIVIYKKRRIMPSKSLLEQADAIECYALYKPTGIIVSRKDEGKRPIVYTLLPKEMHNFHYIGRLDFNSEGLLLFTNNPKFARNLENPKNEIPRVYHVKAHGTIDEKKLNRMRKGVIIEGESHRPQSINILPRTKEGASNSWLEITLTTGKNREIRKLLEHFNLQVVKLVRFAYGHISIKDFNREKLYRLTERDIKKFTNICEKPTSPKLDSPKPVSPKPASPRPPKA
ncbi:MAG: pseudouridine synthase [Proteobacteria bacterium]|jgi:23S rRNA pseudouridine2605 synthase|nr:pseudouridine synthase [Pseudomonadota bacterium]